MAWWLYVVLIFLVVLAIGFLFYFFQIKTEEQDDLIEQSKQRLDDMVNTFNVLIALAKENPKIQARIEEVQDQIRYSEPATNKRVAEQDARISARVGDLKILLARAKAKGTYYGCERALSEIELLLVERNAHSKR